MHVTSTDTIDKTDYVIEQRSIQLFLPKALASL